MTYPDICFSALFSAIEKSTEILVITHEYPDGDAAGSAAAMSAVLKDSFGKTSFAVHSKTPFPDAYDYLKPYGFSPLDATPDFERYDLIITLDCGNMQRTGYKISGNIINIDHHGDNSFFGKENYVFPDASSTCEILFIMAKQRFGLPLPLNCAVSLLTGIVTDTGSFRFSSTSSFTHQAVSDIRKSSEMDYCDIINKIYFEEPYAKVKLLGKIIENAKLDAGICYSFISSDIFSETKTSPQMVEGLVNILSGIKEAKLGLLFQEIPSGMKLSVRSRGTADCRKIAALFGGGGHTQAAGARIEGKFEDVIDMVLKKIREVLS